METLTSQNFILVTSYESLYLINSNGEVVSLHSKNRGKVMAQKIDRAGYLRVKLNKGGKHRSYYSHRLVAETFLPNPLNKPMVNHKNGNKLDNRIENLEWCTNQENMLHAVANNLVCPFCKKKVVDKCTGKEYTSIKEAALRMSIPYGELKAILRKRDDVGYCLELAA